MISHVPRGTSFDLTPPKGGTLRQGCLGAESSTVVREHIRCVQPDRRHDPDVRGAVASRRTVPPNVRRAPQVASTASASARGAAHGRSDLTATRHATPQNQQAERAFDAGGVEGETHPLLPQPEAHPAPAPTPSPAYPGWPGFGRVFDHRNMMSGPNPHVATGPLRQVGEMVASPRVRRTCRTSDPSSLATNDRFRATEQDAERRPRIPERPDWISLTCEVSRADPRWSPAPRASLTAGHRVGHRRVRLRRSTDRGAWLSVDSGEDAAHEQWV